MTTRIILSNFSDERQLCATYFFGNIKICGQNPFNLTRKKLLLIALLKDIYGGCKKFQQALFEMAAKFDD